MRRVLITGGSGFIGTNAVTYFTETGATVLNVDVVPPACQSHHRFWHPLDILDSAALVSAVREFAPTEVVHLAARTDLGYRATLDGFRENTEGVANLLHALTLAPTVRSTFFASSMLVCDLGHRPRNDDDLHATSVYGQSKIIGERLVRASQIRNWVIGRLTSIWGPWFGEPYRKFFELVANRLYVNPDRSAATKTFGYVENLLYQIDALLRANPGSAHGRTFYLGDYPPLNIAHWADEIARVYGVRQPRRLPIRFLQLAAIIGDSLQAIGLRTPITRFRLRNMTTDNIVDVGPIAMLAGSPKIPTIEGIRRTVNWLRMHSRPTGY